MFYFSSILFKTTNLIVLELPENWGEIEERVKDGVTFHLKYLGSTLVEELERDDDSYGDTISAEAIRTIVAMVSSTVL